MTSAWRERLDRARKHADAHRRGRLHLALTQIVNAAGDVAALRDGRATVELCLLVTVHGKADVEWMIGVVEGDVAEGLIAAERKPS